MNSTTIIDITTHSRWWRRLQAIGAITLCFFLAGLFEAFFETTKALLTSQVEVNMIINAVTIIPTSILFIFIVWKHTASFSVRSITILKFTLGFVPPALLVTLITLHALIGNNLEPTQEVAPATKLTAAQYGFLFSVYAQFFTLFAFFVLVGPLLAYSAAKRLLSENIDKLDVAVSEILRTVERKNRENSLREPHRSCTRTPVGCAWIILGLLSFVLAGAVSVLWRDFVFKNSGSPMPAVQFSFVAICLGMLALFRARSHFADNADEVIAVDKRPPVLYLRSFNDESPDHVQPSRLVMFVDRSFEMKIANYLWSVGPFVAIGSPLDPLPKLGAARFARGNDDWQREVKKLMEKSQLVIASVGTSDWIKWELEELFREGHESKSILIYPTVEPHNSWRFCGWGTEESTITIEPG